MLRKNIKQNADQQKHGELNQNDDAAGEQGPAAVALGLGGQQPLYDRLVRAMGGHGEKRSADNSGPKRVFRREIPGEIEELKFVSSRRCDLRHFAPAARNAVQQQGQRDGAAGQIDKKLCDVGPNHRLHAAFEGVKHGQRDDHHHRESFGSAEHYAYDERNRGDAHAFGNRAGNEKRAGGDRAHLFAETFLDERIRG